MGIDAAIQLACQQGISYQAACRLLTPPAPGLPGGRAARPSSRPARGPLPRVNPAPAPVPEAATAPGTDMPTGKDGDAAPFSPSPSPPAVILTLPPAPPPAARPERPGQAEVAAQIESWLAANPVRREPDYGDVQAEYRIFKRDGRWVGRDGKSYLVDNWRLTKADFKLQARKLAKDRGWPWPEDC